MTAMRTQDFSSLLQGIKTYPYEEVENVLEGHFNHLNDGMYSRVYELGDDFVIKLSNNDSSFTKYAIKSLKFQERNSLFPKLHSFETWEVGGHVVTVCVMERLEVDSRLNQKYEASKLPAPLIFECVIKRIINKDLNTNLEVLKYLQDFDAELKIDCQLFEDLLAWTQLSKVRSSRLDLHCGNFGFRPNGELVLFDPVM